MNSEPAFFQYELELGVVLEAYALDPELTEKDLEELIVSLDGAERERPQLEFGKDIVVVETLDSLQDLKLNVLNQKFQFPAELQAYRDALARKLDSEGNYDGDIMYIKGEFGNPLTLASAKYYDFQATAPLAVPSDLVDGYTKGKKVRELLSQYGLGKEAMARQLGLGFIMIADLGNEFCFVQRGKKLAIAPDCMAIPGSTPKRPEDLFQEGTNFTNYLYNHIKNQMKAEFNLNNEEFIVEKCYLVDDILPSPFIAVEIVSRLKTREIAKKAFGNETKKEKERIKQHPIIYSIESTQRDVSTLIQRFPSMYHSEQYLFPLVLDKDQIN